MAHDDEPCGRTPSSAVDYKTLLGAACSALVLLAGVTWGIISADRDDQIESNRATNSKQWERLKELNDAHIRHEADAAYFKRALDELRDDTDDQEARLRALERRR